MNPFDRRGVDYLLAAIAAVAAIISGGYALRNGQAGWTLAGLAVIGFLLSSRIDPPKWSYSRLTVDGLLLVAVTWGVLVLARPLNAALPGGGYPPNLVQTAVLSFILVGGSFLAWRDSSLLFLAVPGIALFGLVGAYDTFEAAPAMFFVFLASTAALFARANMRAMLRLAERAGVGPYERLQRYEWKSAAGPEWALGSAVVVVLLSVLGAPVIQQTAQQVTAPLRVQVSGLRPSENNVVGGSFDRRDEYRVGRGPLGQPSNAPVLYLTMEEPRYLRGVPYYVWRDNAWLGQHLAETRIQPDSTSILTQLSPELREIQGGSSKGFVVESLRPTGRALLVPGVVQQISGVPGDTILRADGTLQSRFRESTGYTLVGTVLEPPEEFPPSEVDFPEFWQEAAFNVQLSRRVRSLVRQATRDEESDYAKMAALTRAIGRQARYNLRAAPVPDGADVVDHFLFETREGYCDLYSTALALTARSIGLPSRVMTGYMVLEDQRDETGKFVVTEAHAHMWTEVYFRGFGWVVFDATEYAEEVPGSGRGMPWNSTLGAEREATIRRVLIGILVLAAAGILAVVAWEWIRRRRTTTPHDRAPRERSENERAVLLALRDLETLAGRPRAYGETFAEFVTRGVPAAAPLIPIVDDLLYGPAQGAAEQRAALTRGARTLAKEAKSR